jgi:hypothetical protein
MICISNLHSGGIDFPASHLLTVLTLLEQISAVFSMLKPHVCHLKILFLWILVIVPINSSFWELCFYE